MSNTQISFRYPEMAEGINSKKFLDAIDTMLKKGRRHFGTAGAHYSHQRYNPEYKREDLNITSLELNEQGERKATKELLEWMKDKPNVVLIENVRFPTPLKTFNEGTGLYEDEYMSHVLVVGDWVILLHSQVWDKSKGTKTYNVVNNLGHLQRGKKDFPGGVHNLDDKFDDWLDYLICEDIIMVAFIYANMPNTTIPRGQEWFSSRVRAVEEDRLIETLDKTYNKDMEDSNHRVIDPTLIAQLVALTVKPYDMYENLLSQKARKGVDR